MKDKSIEKFVVGFQVTAEKKQEIEKASTNYRVDKITVPLTLSQFCRIAVDKLLKELNYKEVK